MVYSNQFFKTFTYLRERQNASGAGAERERERERERESHAGRLRTVSAEPDAGLKLMNFEIMT